jgi:hypothetical protein
LTTDGSANTAEFSGGAFTSSDWGGRGTFTSIAIDVSAVSLVDIEGIYTGFFNISKEFSNFFYQLDAAPVIPFGIGSDGITATSVAVNVLALDVSGASSMTVGFDFNYDGAGDSFDVDSLTVSAIPEPGTFGILACCLGITSIMLRRRFNR